MKHFLIVPALGLITGFANIDAKKWTDEAEKNAYELGNHLAAAVALANACTSIEVEKNLATVFSLLMANNPDAAYYGMRDGNQAIINMFGAHDRSDRAPECEMGLMMYGPGTAIPLLKSRQ